MPRSKSSPQMLSTLRRRELVLELRMSGMVWRDVAAAVISEVGKDEVPKGFDARYAYKDLQRYLEQNAEEFAEHRESLRQLEMERLDMMTVGVWEEAVKGEKDAISTVLSIMGRRARMLGLDSPIEYTVDDFRNLARDVIRVIEEQVSDEETQERIFEALGFDDIP